MRRACWNRQAPGPPRGGWGSRGKRRPWDGWRGTPAPTPHRSGRARAPQALASALARAEVDGAVLVWCSPLPWLRPVLMTPPVSGGASGFLHPSAPDVTCTLHLVLGPAGVQSRRCRLSSARCPLPLDPPWTSGGVDQLALQELPAANEQVGQGRSGDPGFGHKVAAAVGQGGAEFRELSADVGRHLGSAFATQRPGWLHGGILQRSQRLELEIEPDLYERIEELSIRSGRSIPEIIQGLISCSFPNNPIETVLGESLS